MTVSPNSTKNTIVTVPSDYALVSLFTNNTFANVACDDISNTEKSYGQKSSQFKFYNCKGILVIEKDIINITKLPYWSNSFQLTDTNS